MQSDRSALCSVTTNFRTSGQSSRLLTLVQAFDLWKLFEEGGGLLVLFGVIGQVWASSSESERVEEMSSMMLTVGLVFSLAALVGADQPVGTAIATILGGGIVYQ